MGIFRKLFGNPDPRDSRPARPSDTVSSAKIHDGSVRTLAGSTTLEVVGEASYQENLRTVVGSHNSQHDAIRIEIAALLVAETDNPHDVNAISVWIDGLRVGYLSRADAARYRPGLLALQDKFNSSVCLHGVIAGGGFRNDGPGLLGVFLRHEPTDFGIRRHSPIPSAATTMRSGLTDAIASDASDESYDLGWVANLPSDSLQAITMLRRLLEAETDPIDRHFMFHHLEEALYKSRSVFGSALDEYDACCAQHDREMSTIRLAFMTKWGKVPVLSTYKQMCIRLAKEKRFEDALWWAERGLQIYGSEPARPEAVADLFQRAEGYRAKLSPPQAVVDRSALTKEPVTESLICVRCEAVFERVRTRGRKPTLCQDCDAK